MNVINELQFLQDLKYRDLQLKLIPTIDRPTIIGVRMPDLRKLAKKFDEKQAQIFMQDLLHIYYEENMLHFISISNMKNYDDCIDHLERFLPFIDNWAVCDCVSPKISTKNTDKLIGKTKLWAKSFHTHTVRVAVYLLMKYFLDKKLKVEYLDTAAQIKSEEYYVNMMVAWFFTTALAKQWDGVIFVLEDNLLDEWTRNKTTQKARESFRITPEQKQYLKSLKKRR